MGKISSTTKNMDIQGTGMRKDLSNTLRVSLAEKKQLARKNVGGFSNFRSPKHIVTGHTVFSQRINQSTSNNSEYQ